MLFIISITNFFAESSFSSIIFWNSLSSLSVSSGKNASISFSLIACKNSSSGGLTSSPIVGKRIQWLDGFSTSNSVAMMLPFKSENKSEKAIMSFFTVFCASSYFSFVKNSPSFLYKNATLLVATSAFICITIFFNVWASSLLSGFTKKIYMSDLTIRSGSTLPETPGVSIIWILPNPHSLNNSLQNKLGFWYVSI